MTFMYLAQSHKGTLLKLKSPWQLKAFTGSMDSWIRAGRVPTVLWDRNCSCVCCRVVSVMGTVLLFHSFRPNSSTLKESTRKREWSLKKREGCWRKNQLLSLRRKLLVIYSRARHLWRQVAALRRTKTERSKSPATLSLWPCPSRLAPRPVCSSFPVFSSSLSASCCQH